MASFQPATLRGCIEQQAVEATTTVDVALAHQIRRTQRSLTAIKTRLSAVQRETQHVKNLRVSVDAALHDTRQPLKSSITRPGTAETKAALDKEQATAGSFSAYLTTGLKDLVEKERELLEMEGLLQRQARWLEAAIMRDNECVTSAPCRPSKRLQRNTQRPLSSSALESRPLTTTPRSEVMSGADSDVNVNGAVATSGGHTPPPYAASAPSKDRFTADLSQAKSNSNGPPSVPPSSASSSSRIPVAPQKPSPSDRTSTAQMSSSRRVRSSADRPSSEVAALAAGGGSGRPSTAKSSRSLSQRSASRSHPRSSVASTVGSLIGDELDPLLWEQQVNQSYTSAQALVEVSAQLRLVIGQEMYKGTQQCGNARKVVFDCVSSSISQKLEARQEMLNSATRMELQLHNLKKQWEGTAKSAQALAKPLDVAAERQYLRAHIPDGVGHALEEERTVLRDGRQQLKRKCQAVLKDLLKTEKERASLLKKASKAQEVIKVERGYLATDNPMSTGMAPRPPKIVGKKVYSRGKPMAPSPLG